MNKVIVLPDLLAKRLWLNIGKISNHLHMLTNKDFLYLFASCSKEDWNVSLPQKHNYINRISAFTSASVPVGDIL